MLLRYLAQPRNRSFQSICVRARLWRLPLFQLHSSIGRVISTSRWLPTTSSSAPCLSWHGMFSHPHRRRLQALRLQLRRHGVCLHAWEAFEAFVGPCSFDTSGINAAQWRGIHCMIMALTAPAWTRIVSVLVDAGLGVHPVTDDSMEDDVRASPATYRPRRPGCVTRDLRCSWYPFGPGCGGYWRSCGPPASVAISGCVWAPARPGSAVFWLISRRVWGWYPSL